MAKKTAVSITDLAESLGITEELQALLVALAGAESAPKRGRKAAVVEDDEDEAPKRGRGRGRKAAVEDEDDDEDEAPKRGRGRGRKVVDEDEDDDDLEDLSEDEDDEDEAPKRGRGRAPAAKRGRR